jgi:hypothetical protein
VLATEKGKRCASTSKGRSKEIIGFAVGQCFEREAPCGISPMGADNSAVQGSGSDGSMCLDALLRRIAQPGLTASPPSSILGNVMRLWRRLAALALTFAVMAGNAAICAGWMPTREARMACCADGAECPMHKGDSHRSGSGRGLTQAQADSCCASSERKHSNKSDPSFVPAITAAVLGAGTVLPADIPALVLSDGWRTSAPISVAPVSKHVLLSVFLV